MNQKQLVSRGARDFALALITFLVVLKVSEYIVMYTLSVRIQSIAIIILTLAPIIPGAAIIVTLLRLLQHSDELQQRIQLFAISFAAGFTGLLTFSYSYFQRLGAPPMELYCVLPIMLILWMIGMIYFSRQYR